jgi:hypothetical protein
MAAPGRKLRLVGMDPSLRNWGLAGALFDPLTGEIEVTRLGIIQPVLPKGKQVRQNSIDLDASFQLYRDAVLYASEAHAVFAEVPVGSQSARAMASYGICVGVLGALRAKGIAFFEVTATEVKLATGLKKDASKKEMITWARAAHPATNWPLYSRNGEVLVSEAIAEHQADAIAAIYAGVRLTAFQQLLQLAA